MTPDSDGPLRRDRRPEPVVRVSPRIQPGPNDAFLAARGDGHEMPAQGEPAAPAPHPRRSRMSAWALTAAIVALVMSWFVGWGIPVALLAVGIAIAALRRPHEPRGVAAWALVLGLCATAFSLGWLLWAAMTLEQLG